MDWSSIRRALPTNDPVGGWTLGACGIAVEACLGSIVYRAGEVHAVGNFIKTSDCDRYSVLVIRICAPVTMNRFERSMRVVGCNGKTMRLLDDTTDDIQKSTSYTICVCRTLGQHTILKTNS